MGRKETAANEEQTVLVVDDDDQTRELFTRALSRQGFVVRSASDGRTALAMLEDAPVDVVLLDASMPGMSGLDVLESIRQSPEHATLPVLFVTGQDSRAELVAGLEAGATDYIVKPVDLIELAARVRAHLRHREVLVAATTDGPRPVGDTRPTAEREAALRALLDGDGPSMLFQPIVDLLSMRTIGAEALARFGGADPAPESWFADAHALGLDRDLELCAVRNALLRLDDLPVGTYLSINAGPATAASREFESLLSAHDADRVVIEITEHTDAAPTTIAEAVGVIRRHGARVAVDDAGAGFSGLQQILQIEPDIIKLDIELVRDIDRDAGRGALIQALTAFATSVETSLVGEGVETQAELDALVAFGVGAAQGYFLARPGPLPLPETVGRATPRARDSATITDLATVVRQARSDSTDVETLARRFLDAVIEATDLEISYVTILHPRDPAELEHRFITSVTDLTVPEGFTIPYDESLCARCRAKGLRWTAAVPTDIPGSPAAEALGIQTFVSVPLASSSGRTLGTLCAAGREPRFLSDAALGQIELYALLLADRIERDEADG